MTARILVVDDVFTSIKMLAAKLKGEYYEVLTASEGLEALDIVRSSDPDLVLLDVMMPGMDGFEVCREIKNDPETTHIPVVMVTALNDSNDRVKGLDCGADDFLTKPVSDARLFARVTSLVRMKRLLDQWRLREETTKTLGSPLQDELELKHDRKSHIVILDDETIQSVNIKEILNKDNHAITLLSEGKDIVTQIADADADAIIINLIAEDDASLRLASQIRSREDTRLLPILLVGGEEDMDLLVKSMELGVNDYLSRPIDEQELMARVRTLVRRKHYQDHLHDNFLHNLSLALVDSLTGLHNRRYLNTHLESVMRRMAKNGKPVSLMMIDIDLFKQINDDHGHVVGDEVLCETAHRIALNVRGFDMATRYGGDEFVVIMPDTSIETATKVANRLCEIIAEEPFKMTDGKDDLNLTISIGVTKARDGRCTPKDILKRADEALYKAKEKGRNNVVTQELA